MLCLFSSQYSNSAGMILPCLYMALQGPGQGKERNSGRRNNNNYIVLNFPVIDWSCFRDHRSPLFICISHGIHLDLEDSSSRDMSLLKV